MPHEERTLRYPRYTVILGIRDTGEQSLEITVIGRETSLFITSERDGEAPEKIYELLKQCQIA